MLLKSNAPVDTTLTLSAEASFTKIASSLEAQFPYTNPKDTFNFFPFSNESWQTKHESETIIAKLKRKIASLSAQQQEVPGAALVFGESNFLSLLDTLDQMQIKLVILADIEPGLMRHTQHLLHCIGKAKTRQEFLSWYCIDNPATLQEMTCINTHGKREVGILSNSNLLKTLLKSTPLFQKLKLSLGKEHFLFSEENFLRCKEVCAKLAFAHVQLDFLNKKECKKIASFLKEKNLQLKFVNITNIHDYDDEGKRYDALRLLLENAKDCYLMYSQYAKTLSAFAHQYRLEAKLKTSHQPMEKYFKQISYKDLLWFREESKENKLPVENKIKSKKVFGCFRRKDKIWGDFQDLLRENLSMPKK